MDYLHMLSAIPTVIGIVSGIVAGTVTAHKLLTAACEIVYLLAGKELENHEKRAAAVGLLYAKFPKFGTVIPTVLMGKIVDLAWEDIIKPVATNQPIGSDAPPPAAPPAP